MTNTYLTPVIVHGALLALANLKLICCYLWLIYFQSALSFIVKHVSLFWLKNFKFFSANLLLCCLFRFCFFNFWKVTVKHIWMTSPVAKPGRSLVFYIRLAGRFFFKGTRCVWLLLSEPVHCSQVIFVQTVLIQSQRPIKTCRSPRWRLRRFFRATWCRRVQKVMAPSSKYWWRS